VKTQQIAAYETAAKRFVMGAPSQARSIFVSWQSIATFINLDYEAALSELDIDENYFINLAFERTHEYIEGLETEFSETEILEIENKYLENIKNHWSLSNILLSHLNLKLLTDLFNDWSKKGPEQPEIFGVTPVKGLCLSYICNSAGISFTIYEPFIIPYTELFYREHSNLPEWNFEDLSSQDVVETYFWLANQKEQDIIIDLNNWAEQV